MIMSYFQDVAGPSTSKSGKKVHVEYEYETEDPLPQKMRVKGKK